MPVTVDVLYRPTMRDLDHIHRSQIPYALEQSLNDTAFKAREVIQARMPQKFIIRKRWVVQGVRVDKAKKSDMVRYGFIEAAVKHLDENMTKQETGGTIIPKKRSIAIPGAKLRTTKTQSISKRRRPAALLANKKRYFIEDDSRGNPAIFQRVSKTRAKVMYLLRPRAEYKPRYDFERTVQEVTDKHFHSYFGKNFARALASMGVSD